MSPRNMSALPAAHPSDSSYPSDPSDPSDQSIPQLLTSPGSTTASTGSHPSSHPTRSVYSAAKLGQTIHEADVLHRNFFPRNPW